MNGWFLSFTPCIKGKLFFNYKTSQCIGNCYFMSELKVGSIVTYYPANQESKKLPNGMQSAPAIITQLFGTDGNQPHANMTVFVANPHGEPYRQEWSVNNKKHPNYLSNEGVAHFDY